VLLVDDAKQVRERLTALLSECRQIQVIGEAGNGPDALAAVDKLAPDAVVLDIRLPGRSGIQLLKEIKQKYPQTTVIMLTNYDFDTYRKQCLQMGADYFFNKTLEFENVVAVLAEMTAGGGTCSSQRFT
jgi:DNA-binding NarL/FixJ family response regulator